MLLRRNLLIFHTGALGDFVLTWPLALALGRLFPQSRVIYVTHAQKGALAQKVLHVESADVEAGWHHLFGQADQLPPAALKLISQAHSIYSFLAGAEDRWTQNVRRLAGEAAIVNLSAIPPADFAGHATASLLEQLRPVPAACAAMEQLLRSVSQRGIRAFPPADGGIIIHPGSGSPQKCWPVERFLSLIRRLQGQGRKVSAVIGEVELERWTPQQLQQLSAQGPVHRPPTYVALGQVLGGASLVIANDSGPGHLAGILGVPTLSLFGPTNPQVWRPLGPSVEVLQAQPLESLSVDEVYCAAQRVLGRGRFLPVPLPADSDAD